MEKDPLSLETRRRIFQFVRERPGSYLRELERGLNMQSGVLQYNLRVLEEMGLLSVQDDGFRKRYFVAAETGAFERKALSILRLKTPRRIVMYLLQHPESSASDILKNFQFSRNALSFHMKRLKGSGLLVETRAGGITRYSISRPEEIARIIITYRETFLDNLVDSFIDSWLQI